MNRELTSALMVGAALSLCVGPAQAGPCSEEIAKFEQVVRESAGTVGAGPMARQSVGAQLSRQPTPNSVKEAEAGAQAAFEGALARAKLLDETGDGAGCMAALTDAKRMFGFQ